MRAYNDNNGRRLSNEDYASIPSILVNKRNVGDSIQYRVATAVCVTHIDTCNMRNAHETMN